VPSLLAADEGGQTQVFEVTKIYRFSATPPVAMLNIRNRLFRAHYGTTSHGGHDYGVAGRPPGRAASPLGESSFATRY
jgi:hypothetical protein